MLEFFDYEFIRGFRKKHKSDILAFLYKINIKGF